VDHESSLDVRLNRTAHTLVFYSRGLFSQTGSIEDI